MNNSVKFILSIAIPLVIGGTASYFTVTNVESWYTTIQKPAWNPPNAVFGPVWTTLYVLMGIALFLIWKSPATIQKKRVALILFAIQLLLNFFWSFIFFDQHQIGLALSEIIVMWFFILLTIVSFSKVSNLAAWLMVPYISWVSFATILNYTIWQLNK